MLKKLYVQIIKILKENAFFFVAFFIMLFVCTYELPYYVDKPGGITDLSSRVEVEGGYSSEGTINLAYVAELKGTIPNIILAQFFKDWNVVKKDEVIMDNETYEENMYRNKLLLKEANHKAVLVAYEKAGKQVSVQNKKIIVTYVAKDGNTDLKLKDQILEVNHQPVQGMEDFDEKTKGKEIGEVLEFLVLRDGKEVETSATVYELEDRKVIGVILTEDMELETSPRIHFSFESSESGPSGGLMMTLAIYNALVEEDITHGKTIVGTGTIDADGSVGAIGGVEYKIKGAVKEAADWFFLPKENYEEALKVVEENEYHITLVPVSTFEEVLEYLEKNVN